MAFCKYCGRQLANGEVCVCQGGANAQVTPPPVATPVGSVTPPPAPNPFSAVTPPLAPMPMRGGSNPAGAFFSNLWNVVISVVKAPATAGCEFVRDADFKTAFAFIGTQAIAVALMVFASRIHGVIVNDSGLVGVLSAFLFAFLGALVTVGLGFLFPLLLTGFTKAFKHQADYKSMLCVSGLHSMVTIPFILVGFLFAWFLPNFCLIFPMIGAILGYFLSMSAVPADANVTLDHLVYVMFLSGTSMFIVIRIIQFLVALPALLAAM